MKLMKSLRIAAAAVLLFSAGIAHAALIQFNLTGDYTASWQLDTANAPDDPFVGVWATYVDVTGSFPGASTALVDITFYSPILDGGFEIYDYHAGVALVATAGPQLYTGLETAPVFTLGTFALTDYDGPGLYLLTISEVVDAAVPEPATGALVLAGMALLAASRKRRNG